MNLKKLSGAFGFFFILIVLITISNCDIAFASSEMLLANSESNSLVTENDEYFIIQQVLGGFSDFFVGSFNASNGYWI